MLGRAFLLAYRSGLRDDPGIEIALRMATYGGAQVMGVGHYGLVVGSVPTWCWSKLRPSPSIRCADWCSSAAALSLVMEASYFPTSPEPTGVLRHAPSFVPHPPFSLVRLQVHLFNPGATH